MGTELIGKGHLSIAKNRVVLVGRRTNPLRGALAIGWRLFTWFAAAAGGISVLLTAIGFGWRSSSPNAFLLALAVGLPTLAITLALVRWMGRRILEPPLAQRILWDQVTSIASNGSVIDIEVQTRKGPVQGRLVPGRRNKGLRTVLGTIRDAALPGGKGGDATRLLRPVWVDQAVILVLLVVTTGAAWFAEPWATSLLMGIGEAREGPRGGIPVAMPVEQIDARHAGACQAGDVDAPALTNRRDGDALVWAAPPESSGGWSVLHLRWVAGTGWMERVVRAGDDPSSGRIDGFFLDDHTLGVSLVVREKHAETVATLLDSRDLEALRTAWCAGLVGRVDITRTPPPGDAPVVTARRRGRALMIGVDGIRQGDLLLPVRWRERPGMDLFDTCEVPVADRSLGLLRALPERRLGGFFVGESDRARVLLIPKENRAAAEVLARSGAAQRCLMIDALLWAGVAHALGETADDRAHLMRERAASIARAKPLAPAGAGTAVLLDGVARRWREVSTTLQLRGQGQEARDAAAMGFLDALDWARIVDTVSFTGGLPHVEILRQRLEGASVDNTLGERFLMRFAEEFLTRVPVEPSTWNARIDVGEEWLEVERGTQWEVNGGPVRVGTQAAADAYSVVGRFVLMDVARRVEEDLNGGRVGLRALAWSFWIRFRLKGHDIALDIEKSSARKGLEAWVTGDFEYLIDRLTKKAAEKLRDEQAANAAAWKADYRLQTQYTDGAALRTSDLLRDGRNVGWVAQIDGARTEMDYVMPEGRGVNAGQLAGDGRLLLATAGSYVTAEGRTSGLSVLDGKVRNFLISPKMDGLVVVRGDGTLAVLDLKRGSALPGTERVLRPLRSLSDFHALLSWLRKDGASAFQTHLLAAEGRLVIDGDRASGTLRERRLLVDAHYRGHPITVVVDIPGAHRQSLFEAAVVALKSLETDEADGGPGLEVRAIANLDVGSYDILEAKQPDGTLLRRGPQPLSKAMNLLVVRM
jgi:hypothetical protein